MLKTAAWRRGPWQDQELGRRFWITANFKYYSNDQIHDLKIESIVSEWVLRTALPSCKSIYRNVTRGMASSRCTIAHQNPRRDQRPIPSSTLSSNHSCIFANLQSLRALSVTVHYVLFGQYFFLPTKQAETYLKIYVLIYHSTYIYPSLLPNHLWH